MVVDKHNDGAREAMIKALKITAKDPKEILKELKGKPAEEIMAAYSEIMMVGTKRIIFTNSKKFQKLT